MFNPTDIDNIDGDAVTTPATILMLDDVFSIAEVEACIKRLKQDKTEGPDGLCPGIFKLLSPQWILSISTQFNSIVLSGSYTSSW